MGLKEYRDRLRKEETLPSGEKAVIRKLSSGDFLEIQGSVPGINWEKPGDIQKVQEELDKNIQESIRINNLFLCRGIVKFAGEDVRVVVKRPEECSEGELSVDEIEKQDADWLVLAIAAFTNPSVKKDEKGVAPEGARFSGEQGNTDNAS